MQFYIFIRTGVNQTEKEKNSTGKEKVDETPIAKGSYTDVIISCSIAVGLLIFGVLAVVFVKRKRKHTSSMCNKLKLFTFSKFHALHAISTRFCKRATYK
jgi:hypothetical protein